MANEMQQALVSLLGGADERAATSTITEIALRALQGDEAKVSATLAIFAEIFRQGRLLPTELAPFIAVLLDRAAVSSEACKAVAGAGNKPGRRANAGRDSLIVAQELLMRDEVPKKSARMAILANAHSLGIDAIKTILDADARRKKKADEVISRADVLIAASKAKQR